MPNMSANEFLSKEWDEIKKLTVEDSIIINRNGNFRLELNKVLDKIPVIQIERVKLHMGGHSCRFDLTIDLVWPCSQIQVRGQWMINNSNQLDVTAQDLIGALRGKGVLPFLESSDDGLTITRDMDEFEILLRMIQYCMKSRFSKPVEISDIDLKAAARLAKF